MNRSWFRNPFSSANGSRVDGGAGEEETENDAGEMVVNERGSQSNGKSSSNRKKRRRMVAAGAFITLYNFKAKGADYWMDG